MPDTFQVEIKTPDTNSSFDNGVEVEFVGNIKAGVSRVDLIADGKFPMGSADQTDYPKWTLRWRFSASGMRRIEAIAFDENGNFLGMDFVDIIIKTPAVSDQRKAIVAQATSQLGLQESPLGSNSGAQIKKYFDYCGHIQPNDWCFMLGATPFSCRRFYGAQAAHCPHRSRGRVTTLINSFQRPATSWQRRCMRP